MLKVTGKSDSSLEQKTETIHKNFVPLRLRGKF